MINDSKSLASDRSTGLTGRQQPAQHHATRTKGPLVWRDMDQQDLDDAYDQSVYAPNLAQITSRWATNSEAARNNLGNPRRFAYGPTPIEKLDVYVTDRSAAPINVFIHGGAWREGLSRDFAFLAEIFVRAGAHFVVPDFINVEESGGTLMPMADQVRRAIAWTYRNAASFGGDPSRLYVSGHSSGAHLAAVSLTTDWTSEFHLPSDLVKGGLCCSGMFDLEPVRLSFRRTYVRFTDEMERSLSPQRHLQTLTCSMVLAYGTHETPEFQRQTRDFAEALRTADKAVQLLVGEGYNHFEILETLANPFGLLGRAVLQQMKLSRLTNSVLEGRALSPIRVKSDDLGIVGR